jgi:hypothetical protein
VEVGLRRLDRFMTEPQRHHGAIDARPRWMASLSRPISSERRKPAGPHLVAAFQGGLKQTGFVDGQNVAMEYRWADGHGLAKRYDAFDAKSYAALSRKSESVRLPLSVPGAVSVPRLADRSRVGTSDSGRRGR